MTTLDQTALTALAGMQEAHSAKLWDKVLVLGDAWQEARGEMPAPAAILYAESLMVTGRIDEALQWSSNANALLTPQHKILKVAALTTLARALSRSGDYHGSMNALRESVKIDCDDAESREKQGHIQLAISKNWRKGWALQEARLANADRQIPANMRFWNGVDRVPVGVLHEQGIGDAILSARFLPVLATRTGHPVTWYGPKMLQPWIGALPNVIVGDLEQDITKDDGGCVIRAMSLPHHLRCDSPYEIPPAIAPEALVARHQQAMMARLPLKVGVCWKGSSSGWHDFERSYSYDQFAKIVAPLDGVEFVNLCHEAEVPSDAPFGTTSFADIWESGTAIADCHVVVSVDTSVVHQAGSLHLPTLALVPTVSDWRYRWPFGKTTPWYPSVTVIRRATAYALDAIDEARATVERVVAHLKGEPS